MRGRGVNALEHPQDGERGRHHQLHQRAKDLESARAEATLGEGEGLQANDKRFVKKVQDVVGLYLDPPRQGTGMDGKPSFARSGSGGDVEGGEQRRRVMAFVVVRHGPGLAFLPSASPDGCGRAPGSGSSRRPRRRACAESAMMS